MTSITALKVPIFPQQNGAPRAPSPTRAANATWLLLQINRLIDELDVILTALMDEEGSFWTVEDRAALSTSLATIVGGINGHSAQITALQTTQGTQGLSLTDQASQITALQTAQGTQGQSLTDQASQITALQTTQGTQGQTLTGQASQITALQTTQGTQGQSLTDQASQITALQTSQGTQGQALTGLASQITVLQTTQGTQGQTLTDQAAAITGNTNRLTGLETNDQKRALLLEYGSPALPNAAILPKGQLAFPQNPSPSGNFNTLDDYREFIFTPILRFGGANIGITYSYAYGAGVKIGRLVTVWISILLTNKGSATGAATIASVPFLPDTIPTLDTGTLGAALAVYRLQGSANVIEILTTAMAAVTNTTFTNTSSIVVNLTYLAKD
jgi:hypothetical protein